MEEIRVVGKIKTKRSDFIKKLKKMGTIVKSKREKVKIIIKIIIFY